MQWCLSLVIAFAMTFAFLYADNDDDARAALALASASSKPEMVAPPKKAYAAPLPASGPFVLFVGVDEYAVSGKKTYRNDVIYDLQQGVYYVTASNEMYRVRENEKIDTVIRDREVSQLAPPFDPFSPLNQRGTVPVAVDGRVVNGAGLRHHSGHNCPSCGAYRNVITGSGPGGTHTHSCPRCNVSWYH